VAVAVCVRVGTSTGVGVTVGAAAVGEGVGAGEVRVGSGVTVGTDSVVDCVQAASTPIRVTSTSGINRFLITMRTSKSRRIYLNGHTSPAV